MANTAARLLRQSHRSILAISILTQFNSAFAASEEPLQAVVITATRQATRVDEQLADVTVIDRAAIEQAGASTLPDLLSRQTGAQIITNGGLGKASAVMLRGANAEHTLLLVDGIPVGSATLGLPSITNLPLSQIERVEILRGSASSLYGSDAIGGVIQVFTKDGTGPARPEAYFGYGSYGTWQASAGVAGGDKQWSYSLRASQLSTRGYNVASDPAKFNRVNYSVPNPDTDPYRNTSLGGRLAFRPAEGHELGVTFLGAKSRNHYDAGGPTVDAYSNDLNRSWTVYSRNKLAGVWTSTLRYGEALDHSDNYAPNHSRFATRQSHLSWQNDVKVPLGKLMLAAEQLQQSVDSTTPYTVGERTVRALILGYNGAWQQHRWQVSSRRDNNSQYGAKTTGNLAYGYQLTPEWQARLVLGTAFRAPSFNQLYYPDYGNPNLKPEQSRNREAGLHWISGGQHASLSYFDNRISNLIAVYPVENIGRSRITGLSVEYGLAHGAWRADVSADISKPINEDNGMRLPRRAAQLAKFSVSYAPGPWTVGMELNATGDRYDDANQSRALGSYQLLNLFGRYKLDRDWTLEARANNILNKNYQTAWAYAEPRANVAIGIRYAPR